MSPYDAFLLVSFGGPEGRDEVIPFLQNVTRGRGVPPGRLEQVAEHYYRFGGVSPINQQCRDLIAAIEKDFAAAGIALPVYWGNRNWEPYLAGTVRAMATDGVRRALAFVTSAYSSYSGCRQYLDDIELARAQAGPAAPRIDKIRPYFNHPGFVEPLAASTRRAIESLPVSVSDDAEIVFTAHSIPAGMAAASGPGGRGAYQAQLAEAAGLVAERVGGGRRWRLAYQSRSGPPSQPWFGPDVEAAETAGRLGLPLARAATPGTDPAFIAMITELVRERLNDAPRAALGDLGVLPDRCPAGCCAAQPAAQAGQPAAQAGQPAAQA